jgi:hypothetical protein
MFVCLIEKQRRRLAKTAATQCTVAEDNEAESFLLCLPFLIESK